MQAFEIRNPSFSDMNLQAQIAVGINDWCVRREDGHEFYGRTQREALEIAAMYAEVPA
jgi:hypothetical protein